MLPLVEGAADNRHQAVAVMLTIPGCSPVQSLPCSFSFLFCLVLLVFLMPS